MQLKRNSLFLCVLAVIAFPGASAASVLYSIEFSSGTGFYTMNQTTGAKTFVGNTGNTSTGDLTSDEKSTIWTNDMTNDNLLTVNPATGAITSTIGIMGVTGGKIPIVSLAFDTVTHALYGNTAVGFGGTTDDTLFRIDPVTGAATLIGAIGFNTVYALGFDHSGTLFGISQNRSALLKISTSTGAGTMVAPVTLAAAYDLAFRPEDNKMFVADSAPGTFSLYTMDSTTGAATLVGPYGGSGTNLVGLAFLTPEPGTVGLMLGGLALLGLKARSRRNRS
jgi:PEP-CTERM motif